VLDEHLLNEAVRLLRIVVVMTLADLADLGELLDPELTPALAKGLECVFALPRQNDVLNQPQVIALPWGVGEVLGHTHGGAGDTLQGTTNVIERTSIPRVSCSNRPLQFLEHALVLTHAGDVTRAQISESLILGL
jgi:hypothetical protein